MGDNGFNSISFVLRLLCLFVAINCRFQDKYLLDDAMSCSGNLARAFSPRFVFQFVTWGVAPGWFEDAPLALTVVAQASRPCVGCTIRTGGTPVPLPERVVNGSVPQIRTFRPLGIAAT